jgi:adenylylsulfate kinase
VSPYLSDRVRVRELHEAAGLPFYEVFVDCPLEAAERRDPKGLYKKARSGEIKQFTGITDVYEAPPNPDIHLLSTQLTVEEEVEIILQRLERDLIISPREL